LERTKLEHYIGQVLVALENSQRLPPRLPEGAFALATKFDRFSGTARLDWSAML